jgi:long-chain acyl-CoA synthetase
MGSNQSRQERIESGVWIGKEKQGETRILRHPEFKDSELSKGCGKVNTLWEAFEESYKDEPGSDFLGTRKYISKGQYGEYEWKTYQEIYDLVLDFARGIITLDLCPTIQSEHDGEFKFMGIYSRNKEEWVVTDLACHLNSITVVTLYDTLGEETIPFVLDQTKLTTLAMESKNLKKIIKLRKEGKGQFLKNIILFDVEDEETVKEVENFGLKVYKYPEILEAGKGKEVTFNPCKPETIATFSYTSGTTGVPKGAMISHLAILSAVGSVQYTDIKVHRNDVHLSYLPLAHIAERNVASCIMAYGGKIGFYQGEILKVFEDIGVLKPTILLTVPRVLQKVYDGMMDKVSKSGYIKRTLFNRAVNAKLHYYHSSNYITHSIYDRILFNKIKEVLGGRVRMIVTAAAPISRELKAFTKIAFCCPVIEGYGQTETAGSCCMTLANDREVGHVGGPASSGELKLVDCPSLNYFSNDKDEDGEPCPRGEICLRGNTLFSGYFNDKENTEKTIDKDGWVHTGDVGCILKGGKLKIIDRVKNIFKLANGEYVAPEKVENVLVQHKYVAQIMVHGESLENYLIAIIHPNKETICDYLNSQGKKVTTENVHEFFEDESLLNHIIKELDLFGRSKGLNGFEVIKKVYLSNDMFTIDNGLLTATMKLKRNEAKKHFSELIKKLYSS